ncbi:SPOR domain-containing protein [Microbacterium lushaniae]|uniref:SPOR domain-containing protein n=1 Tax=Microbacterium lushaniae TaxID=2614639 RepID=A0A5J6L499_9MICO|nr:SPOR domain-containing protein [Microbacterium lushaniae]QEW03221.1 SPOR domain-containing protein [Microbacterium lushaniae]
MSTEGEKYWYNLSTGEVERGYASPAIDRAGPFDTAEEAARAPELFKERSRAWADDEAREDNWGAEGSRN